MRRLAQQQYRWVYPLAAVFLYAAVFLRGTIYFRNSSYLIWVLGVLFLWLILAVTESKVSRKIYRYFPFYLLCQTILVFILLLMPDSPDFFAALLMVLGMQAMLRLNVKTGVLWMGVCALGIAVIFLRTYQLEALALTLVYTVGMVILGFYALATRRAQDARLQNQKLAQQLGEANEQLTVYSKQMEQLGAARERTRLARELHDSVTQTVFSMSMTAQSAGLLLDRNPGQAKAQLERLGQLAESALSEMKLLVSELHPTEIREGGLPAALRQYVQGRVFPGELSVSIQSEGREILEDRETQGLLRIIQEALNNAAKHSRASQASVILHLEDPLWIEVTDRGQGFDLMQALEGNSVGLKSMYERAAEIGWTLNIYSSSASGTKVRAEKIPKPGEQ